MAVGSLQIFPCACLVPQPATPPHSHLFQVFLLPAVYIFQRGRTFSLCLTVKEKIQSDRNFAGISKTAKDHLVWMVDLGSAQSSRRAEIQSTHCHSGGQRSLAGLSCLDSGRRDLREDGRHTATACWGTSHGSGLVLPSRPRFAPISTHIQPR